MKLFVDVSVLNLATYVTGIQRVTREIAIRLVECEEMDVVLLHYNAAKNTYFKIDNVAFINYYKKNQGIKERMITGREIQISEIKEGTIFFDLDAVWMSRMKRSYLLPIIKKQGARIVVHVYDVIPITHPQYCLERGVYNFMDYIGAHLQYADKIITNAKATVDELKKLSDRIGCLLPECAVVSLGADFKDNRMIKDEEVSENLVKVVNESPFVLMVGTIEPRKNHKLLVDAYDHNLKNQGYHIIIAGAMGWNMAEFDQKLKGHSDYNKGIYHFSGLGDKEIAYLYQHAKYLAFLSYTEGFGLPIIEAMHYNTPVVAVDIPVLREVGGEYCVWFEQDNVEELCEEIKCSNNMPNANEKSDRKPDMITWDNCCRSIIEVILERDE